MLLVTGPYRLSTDHTHAPRGKDVPARTRWACKHAQSSVRALAAVRTTRRPGRPAGGARARAPVRWSLTPSVRYVYLARSLASFRAQLSSNYTQSTRARRAPGGRLTQGQADESIEQRLNGGEGPLRHPATCCAPPRPSSVPQSTGEEEGRRRRVQYFTQYLCWPGAAETSLIRWCGGELGGTACIPVTARMLSSRRPPFSRRGDRCSGSGRGPGRVRRGRPLPESAAGLAPGGVVVRGRARGYRVVAPDTVNSRR